MHGDGACGLVHATVADAFRAAEGLPARTVPGTVKAVELWAHDPVAAAAAGKAVSEAAANAGQEPPIDRHIGSEGFDHDKDGLAAGGARANPSEAPVIAHLKGAASTLGIRDRIRHRGPLGRNCHRDPPIGWPKSES